MTYIIPRSTRTRGAVIAKINTGTPPTFARGGCWVRREGPTMTTTRRLAAVLDPASHGPRVEWAMTIAYSLTFTAVAYIGLVLGLAMAGVR